MSSASIAARVEALAPTMRLRSVDGGSSGSSWSKCSEGAGGTGEPSGGGWQHGGLCSSLNEASAGNGDGVESSVDASVVVRLAACVVKAVDAGVVCVAPRTAHRTHDTALAGAAPEVLEDGWEQIRRKRGPFALLRLYDGPFAALRGLAYGRFPQRRLSFSQYSLTLRVLVRVHDSLAEIMTSDEDS
eukprot:1178839-Prorocentrum_minimum.AAC.2